MSSSSSSSSDDAEAEAEMQRLLGGGPLSPRKKDKTDLEMEKLMGSSGGGGSNSSAAKRSPAKSSAKSKKQKEKPAVESSGSESDDEDAGGGSKSSAAGSSAKDAPVQLGDLTLLSPRDSVKCSGCGKSIAEGETVYAVGKRWHKKCLKCIRCGVPVGADSGTTMYDYKGYPFCKEHAKHAKKSGLAPLDYVKKETGKDADVVLRALASPRHQEEQEQAKASAPAASRKKKPADKSETASPAPATSATTGPKCCRCHQVIASAPVDALDKKWHLACLKCPECSVPLAGPGSQALYEVAGEAYCETHAKSAIKNSLNVKDYLKKNKKK